jgi:predicted outer membrane repeat protein
MAKRQRRRRKERRREHARREGWKTRHSVITGVGVAATATLGLVGAARADNIAYYVGSSSDDSGGPYATDCATYGNTDCTLRDAIYAANANSGYADYVVFTSNVSGTVVLGGDDIQITDPVYIYGRGADVDTISGDDTSRIFDVDLDTAGGPVRVYNVALTHGYADSGGAVRNYDSVLRLARDRFISNNADGHGGAVFEAGNYQSGSYDGTFYSTFSDNHAAQGGAVYSDANWGTLRGSTFTGNSAEDGNGGAIDGQGGYLIDSTVSGNYATGAGGGVAFFDQIGLYGTILANNSVAGSDPDLYLGPAASGRASYDLVEDPGDTGIDTLPTIITGQDPQLGPLQDNGGPTPTLKPAASSPVIDQSASYSYYDQRLGDRIVDNPNKPNAATGPYAGADIGSVELTLAEGPQAVPTPSPTPVPHKKKKCKKKHKRSATAAKKKKCKKKKRRAADAFRFRTPAASAPSWPNRAEHNPFRLRP